jgi:eukaryotic-like serine/threonine-protein kinase
LIGKKLAHFAITGKLGEGGMGVVYEAWDGHLDRAVALKLLPHDALANLARKQRFVQEAKAASALNHPHIVTIYDINSDDGVDYIAMELIRGRTLEQALARGKLRLGEALKYGVQIADALAAAHAAGIVHRDLKPGNIMITERGDVKVLDFGLAKLSFESNVSETDETRTQQAVTEEGSVVGSAPYMSPEQAEGRKVDPRSDIFAFGSLLYEMLTGKRAFHGKNRMATMASILKDEPEPVSKLVPEIPREVDRLVTRCLRKKLDRRSQSMAEIRVAIEDLKEESESGSLPAPVTMVARRRRRWPSYALAGILIAAAAAAFWMFGRGRHASPFHATVLTSFVGRHGEPSLSPDGNQFAFTWDGDVPQGRTHVYISLVGKGTPLRVTPENEAAWGPSWSPDGQSIAYLRRQTSGQKPELHVMPALGGASRKIASGQISSASWSPDARWLLWSEREESYSSSIHASRAGGGDAYKLLDPASHGGAGIGDFDPAVSPDGRKVVLSRCIDDFDCDLYLAGFQEGRLTAPPVQLTHDHNRKSHPRWTNGGKEIVYMLGEPDSELSMGRVRASGGEPLRIDGIGANATSLTIAANGSRLLYSTVSINFDMRRVDLTAADAKPERFLSSTRYEGSPSYSPDGKRIAFSSNRGGAREIWIADADGTNPAPLTSFSDGVAGSPKWSPDGQTIAFDARPGGNADVYAVPAGGGAVKRLTDSPGQDHQPTWSPDGEWIYFGSTRGGGHEIFRMRPDGSGVRQITHNGGYYGLISPDGKWLYYSVALNGLWKMPADGGEATQVLAPPSLLGYYDFVVTSRGICAIGARQSEGWPVVLYQFDGGKPRTLTTLSSSPQMFPELSPDGRWFLYTSADAPVFEIMLVDNFR